MGRLRTRLRAKMAILFAERRLVTSLEALEGPLQRVVFTFQKNADGTFAVTREITPQESFTKPNTGHR